MTPTPSTDIEAGIALLPHMKDALGWAKSINSIGICSRKVEVGVEPFETIIAALEAAATLTARNRELEEALRLATDPGKEAFM